MATKKNDIKKDRYKTDRKKIRRSDNKRSPKVGGTGTEENAGAKNESRKPEQEQTPQQP